jgi:hypothetical protein
LHEDPPESGKGGSQYPPTLAHPLGRGQPDMGNDDGSGLTNLIDRIAIEDLI